MVFTALYGARSQRRAPTLAIAEEANNRNAAAISFHDKAFCVPVRTFVVCDKGLTKLTKPCVTTLDQDLDAAHSTR